jgi:hypothetical protein
LIAKKHMGRVAEFGCILCFRNGYAGTPAEVHHIRTGTGAGRRASDFDTIPLCPYHHRQSNEALHVMGRKAWERHHGVTELELLEQTKELLNGKAKPDSTEY